MSRPIKFLLLLILPAQILAWSYGDVVFNELMWMGTAMSPYDEFLELRNMTDTQLNFSATPWAIYRMDELMIIIDSGVLPAHGLFLICRRESSASLITAPRDFISNALVLTNSNTQYSLYAGTSSSATLIDIADDGDGAPMSGRFIPSENIRWSMERSDPPGHGDDPANWHPACLSIGFAAGAAERGTPGAPNYKNVPPTLPNVVISPSFIGSDTTIFAEARNVIDPDDIPGPLRAIFDWFDQSGTRIFTETDSTPPFTSSLPPSLTEPGKTYSLEVYSFDGTDSTGPRVIENIRIHFEKGDLVINELAWAGSMLSPDDQWIEIYNNSGWTIDFSQTPIELLSGSPDAPEAMLTIEDGLLPNGDFFLISNFSESDPRTALDVAPDIVDTRLALRDDSLYLALRDFPGDGGHIIDEVGDGGAPFAGMSVPADSVKYSMARNSPSADGTIPPSWHTAEVSIGWKPHRLERGSPGSENIRNTPPYM
ncbi:MAG TPA: hypothetical protein ENN07_06500, partial [candidate division Zixibacteria bacterium]|nr:hypothetical protein [candidate division Zixibacteria bacterium]